MYSTDIPKKQFLGEQNQKEAFDVLQLISVSNTSTAVGNSDCIKYECLANRDKLE